MNDFFKGINVQFLRCELKGAHLFICSWTTTTKNAYLWCHRSTLLKRLYV